MSQKQKLKHPGHHHVLREIIGFYLVSAVSIENIILSQFKGESRFWITLMKILQMVVASIFSPQQQHFHKRFSHNFELVSENFVMTKMIKLTILFSGYRRYAILYHSMFIMKLTIKAEIMIHN